MTVFCFTNNCVGNSHQTSLQNKLNGEAPIIMVNVYVNMTCIYFSLVQWSGDHGGIVTCGNWSHDDKFILTGSDLDMAIRIWDSQTGALVQTIKGELFLSVMLKNFSLKLCLPLV